MYAVWCFLVKVVLVKVNKKNAKETLMPWISKFFRGIEFELYSISWSGNLLSSLGSHSQIGGDLFKIHVYDLYRAEEIQKQMELFSTQHWIIPENWSGQSYYSILDRGADDWITIFLHYSDLFRGTVWCWAVLEGWGKIGELCILAHSGSKAPRWKYSCLF